MRVIAGKYRSRVLKGPGVLKLRPTSDRLRETFFNVLGPAIESSLFIDAFAGTGAMGIEALSRGASEAIFLESYGKAVQLIQRNLESLEIRNAELIHADVIAGLEKNPPPPRGRGFYLRRPALRKNPGIRARSGFPRWLRSHRSARRGHRGTLFQDHPSDAIRSTGTSPRPGAGRRIFEFLSPGSRSLASAHPTPSGIMSGPLCNL